MSSEDISLLEKLFQYFALSKENSIKLPLTIDRNLIITL